jgi:ComF family protein
MLTLLRSIWPSLRHPGSQCLVCRDWGLGTVCGNCCERFSAAQPRCVQCAIEIPEGARRCGRCTVNPPAFDETVAALDYRFPWRSLISGFKFHGQVQRADFFSCLMVGAIQEARPPCAPCLITAVPSSPAGLRARGYNPAWELARRCASKLKRPAHPDLLRKTRHTAHQAGLKLSQRRDNLTGSFGVCEDAAKRLTGCHVALVDDVMTTGATAHAAASVLKSIGVTRVSVWVLARTPADRGTC